MAVAGLVKTHVTYLFLIRHSCKLMKWFSYNSLVYSTCFILLLKSVPLSLNTLFFFFFSGKFRQVTFHTSNFDYQLRVECLLASLFIDVSQVTSQDLSLLIRCILELSALINREDNPLIRFFTASIYTYNQGV